MRHQLFRILVDICSSSSSFNVSVLVVLCLLFVLFVVRGSTYVDDRFWRVIICPMFSKANLTEWRVKNPQDYVKLMKKFEESKLNITTSRTETYHVLFPRSLTSFVSKVYDGQTIEDILQEWLDGGELYSQMTSAMNGLEAPITWDNDEEELILGSDAMLMLIKPLVNEIVQHASQLMNEITDVEYIFLVGGFSDNSECIHNINASTTTCHLLVLAGMQE